MSCQLTLHAKFQDIRAVRNYLFPHLKEEEKVEEDHSSAEGWDDADWDWKDEPDELGTDEADDGASGQGDAPMAWLQECSISLSPSSDLMALAHQDRLVLLSPKWDDTEARYAPVFEGTLKCEEGEVITCIMCLPLASQKRSTHGGPDWTCVVVGFSSGYVRMYTETGTLLLSQIFSEDKVVKFKCRTYEPPRHSSDAEKHEELSILYKRCLVTLDGFSLFQSLRACRNQVARAAASGSELIQPPPLAYKKWALQDQDKLNDHVSCGMVTPSPFDQMATASMLNGYNSTLKPSPPAMQQCIVAGMGPHIGFFFAVEGSTQPMLSDVAHAVASKLKSALFSQISAASGWFGLGSGKAAHEEMRDRKKPKIEPATSLPSRFGLPDKRREGESISLSPDNRLAATTDSFGRVLLIDTTRGVAVRMWKGYRDAQVGWIQVKEDAHPERDPAAAARVALFLVIYAPRRGILEVWTAQQGPRVAAFNVSKGCILLYPGYNMMGLNNVTCKGMKTKPYQCCLIDPDGVLKILQVPFHVALSDKNSRRARDMHLLKKLKLALKDTNTESGALQTEVIDTLTDIRIASIRQQGVERVLHTKYLSAGFIQAVINAMSTQLQNQQAELDAAKETEKQQHPAADIDSPSGDSDGLDIESWILLQFCQAQDQLLQLYAAVNKLHTTQLEQMETDVDVSVLSKVLSLTPEEVQHLQSQLDSYKQTISSSQHVHFSEDSSMRVVDFLCCFECEAQRADAIPGNKQPSAFTLHVRVRKDLPDSKSLQLASFLYHGSLCGGSAGDLGLVLQEARIPPRQLLNLVLDLWLSEDNRSIALACNLHSLMRMITSLADASEVTVDHNHFSPWWQRVRDLCSQSEKISSALLTSLVGRSIAMEMTSNHKMCESSTSTSSAESVKIDLSEWESVTLEGAQWMVQVKQLEDLLTLQCLLKMKPDKTELSGHIFTPQEAISVSIKKVLEGGRGVVPELVGKWIASHNVLPSMLCIVEGEKEDETEEGENKEESMEVEGGEEITESSQLPLSQSSNPIISQLQAIQKRLPHSLAADILMANCAWEYIVLWNKDPEVIFPLEQAVAFLKCVQNGVLQHGLAAMMWNMFLVKRFSAAAYLMEKVGKAPKERLCRRDVGLSDTAMEHFLGLVVDFMDTFIQASCEAGEVPVFNMEDLWQNIQGPSSLSELALEQKETNYGLLLLHQQLAVILHAVMVFSMKSLKPLSLFDTKGRNAFFKQLHSYPLLPNNMTIDSAIIGARRQFMCRVITQAVVTLGEPPVTSTRSGSPSPPLSPKIQSKSNPAIRWPSLMLPLAKELGVEQDELRRHHVCELYSSGWDKLAEDVLLTVNEHDVMGSLLILIAGQRLHHFIYVCDPPDCVEKLSKCSPTLSTWLKTLDPSVLRHPDVPLKDTAALIGQVVNQLPEAHGEYNMAISLVELIQSFL